MALVMVKMFVALAPAIVLPAAEPPQLIHGFTDCQVFQDAIDLEADTLSLMQIHARQVEGKDPAHLLKASVWANEAADALARAQESLGAAGKAGHGDSDTAEERHRKEEKTKAEILLAMSQLRNAFDSVMDSNIAKPLLEEGTRLTDDHAMMHPPLPPFGSLKIAHMISVLPWSNAETTAIQTSMDTAKFTAEDRRPGQISISLHGVQMVGEEVAQLPPAFKLAEPLTRNTATEHGCSKALPFASSIMQSLRHEAPDADLYIITNADVGLVPDFYLQVAQKFMVDGYDGQNILKVLIPIQCGNEDVADNLAMAYNLTEQLPQTHPGSETFVVSAAAIDSAIASIGGVFQGFPPYGAAMIQAIGRSSRNFQTIQGEHWTFHIGSEGECGRGDPNVMGSYEQQVEEEMPTCLFKKPNTGPPDDVPVDSSCDYQKLNKQAMRSAGLL